MATPYTETNAEVIDKALYCLKHGETESVENWLGLLHERLAVSRADALTDPRVEAAAIAMHDVRRDLAKGIGDLSFDMPFDALPDEIKEVDRALARAAILAASPVEQHEAAPAGVDSLTDQQLIDMWSAGNRAILNGAGSRSAATAMRVAVGKSAAQPEPAAPTVGE